jgi:hypothetical protein
VLLVLRRGLLGLAFGGDGSLLAVVAQVRVGLPWGVPPGVLDGLPPFVGEPRTAAGAPGTVGLPTVPGLRGPAPLKTSSSGGCG